MALARKEAVDRQRNDEKMARTRGKRQPPIVTAASYTAAAAKSTSRKDLARKLKVSPQALRDSEKRIGINPAKF
jgi:ribosome-binding protein aMBF1 (putative translation factor)